MNQSLTLTHRMTGAPARRFWFRHGLLPLLLFVAAQALIETLSLDLVLGDWLYRLEGHAWTWRHHWLTEGLIHAGGRQFSLVLLGLVLLSLVLSWRLRALEAWHPGLAYLASAVLTSVSLGHNPHAGRRVLPAPVAERGAWTPNESAGRR